MRCRYCAPCIVVCRGQVASEGEMQWQVWTGCYLEMKSNGSICILQAPLQAFAVLLLMLQLLLQLPVTNLNGPVTRRSRYEVIIHNQSKNGASQGLQ